MLKICAFHVTEKNILINTTKAGTLKFNLAFQPRFLLSIFWKWKG